MPRPSKKSADDKARSIIGAPTMVVPPIMAGIPPPVNVNTDNGPPRAVDSDSFLRVRDSVSNSHFCLSHFLFAILCVLLHALPISPRLKTRALAGHFMASIQTSTRVLDLEQLLVVNCQQRVKSRAS